MGVRMAKGKKSGHLECDVDGCTTRSKSYRPRSPAAPELTVCEAAHKTEGWAFTLGFFAMLMGHKVFCPEHAKGSEVSNG